jgi:broad specificity phosphatase PhoE
MPYLIFVRHSLSQVDFTLPASHWHLSAEGLRRLSLVPPYLSGYELNRVISSQEPKAIETAQALTQTCHLNLEIRAGLHEHQRPQVKFLSFDQFESQVVSFFKYPDCLIFGSETANQAFHRFSTAVNQLICDYPQENLAIVSHGTVISLYVSRLTGKEPFGFWKRLGLPALVILSLPHFQLQQVVESIQ